MEALYNSKEEIGKWALSVLAEAFNNKKINDHDFNLLKNMAHNMIEEGFLRGDISEAWKRSGFGSDILNNLYL